MPKQELLKLDLCKNLHSICLKNNIDIPYGSVFLELKDKTLIETLKNDPTWTETEIDAITPSYSWGDLTAFLKQFNIENWLVIPIGIGLSTKFTWGQELSRNTFNTFDENIYNEPDEALIQMVIYLIENNLCQINLN